LRSRQRDLGPLRLKLEGKHTGFLASFEQRRENWEMRKVGSYKRLLVVFTATTDLLVVPRPTASRTRSRRR
jgi:hypothetical protein